MLARREEKPSCIIIAEHNDLAGREFVRKVRAQVSCPIKAITFEAPDGDTPEGYGVTDWSDDNPTLGRVELEAMAEAAPLLPNVEEEGKEEPNQGSSAKGYVLTPASAYKMVQVKWLWDGRLAIGEFGLLAGREGVGKGMLYASLVAAITHGKLEGELHGEPRDVIIVSTEDSWSSVLSPRLKAAGADLDRVLNFEIRKGSVRVPPSFPEHLPALRKAVQERNPALIVFDPVISRVTGKIDTHKDQQTRQALEPLAQLLDETGTSFLGVIHVSKSDTTDPLTAIMGTRAFTAVSRQVLFVVEDNRKKQQRILSFEKNNHGPKAQSKVFTIRSATVEGEKGVKIETGMLVWSGGTDRTARDVIEESKESRESQSEVQEAANWLVDYLESVGGSALSKEVKAAGLEAGYTASTVKRARERGKVVSVPSGFPRTTTWSLPVGPDTPGGLELGPTGETEKP